MFDTKKLLFIAKNGKKMVEDDDDFMNQDNLVRLKNDRVYILSGNYANMVYDVDAVNPLQLKVKV